MADDKGTGTKIFLSVVVVVLMIPGLIIEPGPLSEIMGIGALGSIWGLDLLQGGND